MELYELQGKCKISSKFLRNVFQPASSDNGGLGKDTCSKKITKNSKIVTEPMRSVYLGTYNDDELKRFLKDKVKYIKSESIAKEAAKSIYKKYNRMVSRPNIGADLVQTILANPPKEARDLVNVNKNRKMATILSLCSRRKFLIILLNPIQFATKNI